MADCAVLPYVKMYGDFVKTCDFAVHCFLWLSCAAGRGKPLPLYNTVRQKKMYNRDRAVDWFLPFRFR